MTTTPDEPLPAPYYVCTTAVGLFHLRSPGPGGPRASGPTDTPSLCGRVRGSSAVRDLWTFDSPRSFQGHHCTQCAALARKAGHLP